MTSTPLVASDLLAVLARHGVEFIVVGMGAAVLQGVPTHLRAGGHILLRTKLGQLDVLGTIEEATRYEDVQSDTVELDLGDFRVKVLSLGRVIEAKTKAGRPKDLAMLPVLKATLREIERQNDAGDE